MSLDISLSGHYWLYPPSAGQSARYSQKIQGSAASVLLGTLSSGETHYRGQTVYSAALRTSHIPTGHVTSFLYLNIISTAMNMEHSGSANIQPVRTVIVRVVIVRGETNEGGGGRARGETHQNSE